MIRRQFLELMGFVLALPLASGMALARNPKRVPNFSTAYFDGVAGRSCRNLDSPASRAVVAARPVDW